MGLLDWADRRNQRIADADRSGGWPDGAGRRMFLAAPAVLIGWFVADAVGLWSLVVLLAVGALVALVGWLRR